MLVDFCRFHKAAESISAYDTYHFYVKWLAGVLWTVTGGALQRNIETEYAIDGVMRSARHSGHLDKLLQSFLTNKKDVTN